MTHSTAAALALANVPGQLVAFDIAECAPAGFQLDLFSSAEQAVTPACEHRMSTLVETRGLGTWQPVEVYACDACGHRREVRLMHEAEDCGFAPECTVCGATATIGSLCADCDYWCDGNR